MEEEYKAVLLCNDQSTSPEVNLILAKVFQNIILVCSISVAVHHSFLYILIYYKAADHIPMTLYLSSGDGGMAGSSNFSLILCAQPLPKPASVKGIFLCAFQMSSLITCKMGIWL
uniref:Uncharacterized protein n=1 Tax=Oryza meridionalis TaxID=40149 RepID=A0A0E0EUA3_9ORYZ